MQDTKKMFSVRLPTKTIRLIKASAILEGISLEDATNQALKNWIFAPNRKLPVGELESNKN